MGRRSSPPLPIVQRELAALGENIRLARLRRGLSAGLVAERAGMARDTLRAVEQGDAGVSLGSVANVLQALGLAKGLSALAADDELGRKLQDARLDARVRPSRPRAKKPPKGTVDLATVVGVDLDRAIGPALVWVAGSDWIQTFLPGAPPRERAPEALRVGDRVTVKAVLSSGDPVFVLVDSAAGERVVMLADLRGWPVGSAA
jgi:transcriptional regulator with XRE-family HTH domain